MLSSSSVMLMCLKVEGHLPEPGEQSCLLTNVKALIISSWEVGLDPTADQSPGLRQLLVLPCPCHSCFHLDHPTSRPRPHTPLASHPGGGGPQPPYSPKSEGLPLLFLTCLLSWLASTIFLEPQRTHPPSIHLPIHSFISIRLGDHFSFWGSSSKEKMN